MRRRKRRAEKPKTNLRIVSLHLVANLVLEVASVANAAVDRPETARTAPVVIQHVENRGRLLLLDLLNRRRRCFFRLIVALTRLRDDLLLDRTISRFRADLLGRGRGGRSASRGGGVGALVRGRLGGVVAGKKGRSGIFRVCGGISSSLGGESREFRL
jgi:hypothetical protein